MVVPNSVLSQATRSRTTRSRRSDTRVEVEVGASYDTPPNEVKAVIRRRMQGRAADRAASREPEVLLVDFAASAITYRVRVWTTDFAADERIRDRIRSRIYYAFRRHGISIPYPIQVQIEHATRRRRAAGRVDARRASFDGVEILAALTDEQRAELAAALAAAAYAAGEVDRRAKATPATRCSWWRAARRR